MIQVQQLHDRLCNRLCESVAIYADRGEVVARPHEVSALHTTAAAIADWENSHKCTERQTMRPVSVMTLLLLLFILGVLTEVG